MAGRDRRVGRAGGDGGLAESGGHQSEQRVRSGMIMDIDRPREDATHHDFTGFGNPGTAGSLPARCAAIRGCDCRHYQILVPVHESVMSDSDAVKRSRGQITEHI